MFTMIYKCQNCKCGYSGLEIERRCDTALIVTE